MVFRRAGVVSNCKPQKFYFSNTVQGPLKTSNEPNKHHLFDPESLSRRRTAC